MLLGGDQSSRRCSPPERLEYCFDVNKFKPRVDHLRKCLHWRYLDTLIKTDEDTPQYIRNSATGAEVATKEVLAVIGAESGAKPVNFGDFQATSSWTFQTGSEKYAELQNAVYVGCTLLKPGVKQGTIVVGFKVAKVISTKRTLASRDMQIFNILDQPASCKYHGNEW